VEPCIPIDLSSNDFVNFFNEEILTIRGKIDDLLPSDIADLSSSGVALETAVYTLVYILDSFSPINLDQLSSTVSISKPSTSWTPSRRGFLKTFCL